MNMSKDEMLSAIKRLKKTIPHPIKDGKLGHDRYLQNFSFFLQQIQPVVGSLTPLLSGQLDTVYDVPERGDACGSGVSSDERARAFFCENFPPFLTLLEDWIIFRFESSSTSMPVAPSPYPKEESITKQISDLKKDIPPPDADSVQFSTYHAMLEVFLTRIESQIGKKLFKELHIMLLEIFSNSYINSELGQPYEWEGGRLGYKEQRPLTPDERKRHRIKGLQEFFAIAEVKVPANIKPKIDHLSNKNEAKNFPSWEGTQVLEYQRAERKLFVDGVQYIIPKNSALQREVLLELAVQRFKEGRNWVTQGEWSGILRKHEKFPRADIGRAFRGAYDHLKEELEETLKKTNVLEWEQGVRISQLRGKGL